MMSAKIHSEIEVDRMSAYPGHRSAAGSGTEFSLWLQESGPQSDVCATGAIRISRVIAETCVFFS